MTGIVCIWPFTIATIPNGWLLCDGNNGTIDMRGYVAIGARAGFDAGAVLGSDTHVHDLNVVSGVNSVDHEHNVNLNTGAPLAGSFDVTDVGGVRQAYDVHQHNVVGVTGGESRNHTHAITDPTELASSKQLSREILFIMKE